MEKLKTPVLRGVIVSVMTPFRDDGGVNLDVLGRHLEWLIGHGVHGVMVAGTAGEYANLSDAERKEIAVETVRSVAGRVPVIVHTGHASRESMLELTRHAERVGADAVMLVPPAIVKPAQDEIEAYFREAAAAVSIGVVIYNNPGRIGVNVAVDTLVRLSAVPNVIAVKDSGRSLPDTTELVARSEDRLTVLAGEADLFLPSLAVGARGGILTICNFAPALHVELFDAFERGDLARARALNARLLTLAKLLGAEGRYHAAIKAAIRMVGMPVGLPRPPLTDVSPEAKAAIERQLDALGLLPRT